MMASDIYIAQKEIRSRTLLVLILGIILSFIFGMLFSRRITGPIDELVEGTRRISRGDLTYKVKARGVNEIRELAGSFNKMADALNDLQRKNHNYFYNVIQSLVRIVEAKDSYTRGHSERVAKYGMKIATRMGFPLDKIELVRETAMLHDIGKLGIQDSILNKEGGLTEEEWEIIRQHPILGEDILRPVSLNHEMLSIVRAHHERYDGNGYPDKLKGDEIGIFAQILSVADAYDAMTSARAYRSPFSRSEAMTELRKNKGAQFNGEIVDIFVEILTEEKN
jgi:putative nucleotidyltransferase with HDIG domain